MAATNDFCDMARQSAHSFGIGHALHGADDGAEVTCNGRLERQHNECLFLGLCTHREQPVMIGDHLLGQ